MIRTRASLIGWGAFLVLAAAAAAAGYGVQYGFAAIAIGTLGLPHGASDLAVIAPQRRPSFLAAYLGCVAAVVLLWRTDAILALTMLLALSAVHFALDGDAAQSRLANWATGIFLIAGPALLHPDDLDRLFAAATQAPSAAAALARALQLVGLFATALVIQQVLAEGLATGERRLRAAAAGATLFLPPLVGFAVGFVLLHARGQTRERQHATGCATLTAYFRSVLPLMAGAFAVLGLVAVEMARGGFGGATFLFAGIAALATPHMLVTPLWRRSDEHRSARRTCQVI